MNKSWLSGLSNVEPPKRKATRPSERLLAWAWQPAQGLWASGREAPPVQAQESSNENLLSVSHRKSVTAHFSRKPFSVALWNSPQMTAILKDISFHWHDGWIRGTGEEGGDRARNAVMTAMPLHHCSFSQSGSHYFPAVAKMLLNGRVELESRPLWLLLFSCYSRYDWVYSHVTPTITFTFLRDTCFPLSSCLFYSFS